MGFKELFWRAFGIDLGKLSSHHEAGRHQGSTGEENVDVLVSLACYTGDLLN